MIKSSNWLSGKEASVILNVEERYLDLLRERGYLKPGSHWRSSNEANQIPWKPKVSYLISGCMEVIEYCQHNNESFEQQAA